MKTSYEETENTKNDRKKLRALCFFVVNGLMPGVALRLISISLWRKWKLSTKTAKSTKQKSLLLLP
jgi:hypothetical protein